MVIKGILKDGGRAVISGLEHNAVWRPLHALSPQFPIYDIARVTPGDEDATVQAFHDAINRHTKVIICTHASNVFGVTLPIRRIGELARKHGLLFVVDGAQTAGTVPLDMKADHIDFLCVPGHKGLYGPMGTGMLICGDRYDLPSMIQGGTGSRSRHPNQPDELPDRLESGTLNVPGICGLRAGMEFVRSHGITTIAEHERQCLTWLYDRLSNCKGVQLYTNSALMNQSAPLLSLNVGKHHSEETGSFLASQDIAVRAGLHCAPLAHHQYGTLERGTVRIAPSVFTPRQDMELVCKKISQYEKM